MSSHHIAGPDVSRYQGSVDWHRVASANEFGIAQACDGIPTRSDPVATDPAFAANWRGMRDAELIRGAYCFSRPAPGRRAKEEVDHLYALVKDAGGFRGHGDLGLIPDFEWNAEGMSTGELERWVEEWWKAAEEIQGRPPITYTGSWWRSAGLGLRARGPLWLAAYTDRPDPYVPHPSFSRSQLLFWQYTDEASVPGVAGKCDRSWFMGSKTQLVHHATLPAFVRHNATPHAGKGHHKPKKGKPVKPKPVKNPPKSKRPRRPAGAPADLPRKFWHHWRFPWGARARHSGAFHRWLWANGYLSPHFTREEWRCHDGTAIPSSLRKNAQRHAFNMERMRHELGDQPMPTISPYRDPAYNAQIGGASDSRHKYADATDHSKEWLDATGRTRVLRAAEKVFAKGGMGIYPWGAIHFDSRGYRARWSSW